MSKLYKELYIATVEVDIESCTMAGYRRYTKRHLLIRADCHEEAVEMAETVVARNRNHRLAQVLNLAEILLEEYDLALAPDKELMPWHFVMWVESDMG